MRFDHLAHLNPSTKIPKGEIAPFVEMSALPEHSRDIREITERPFKGSGSRFQDGDTLIARITPCLENGKGALVSGLGPDVHAFGSTEFIVARAKNPSDRRFIYYLTRLEAFRETAIARMEGTSGRQRVAWQQIASIEVPDLPRITREAIGEVLGALDDKIELNRKTAATLEAMARALYRSWFVDFDPVHAKAEGRAPAHMPSETAALFPARFGEDGLPEGWEATTIGEVAEIVGGATPKSKEPTFWEGGHHLWATPKDLSGLAQPFLFETGRCVTDAGLAKIGSRLSPAGSLLLSSRAPIGYLAIAAEPVAVNQGFIVIRETEEITGLEAYFWCAENMELIHANANGSTFQEISKKNFRPMEYLLAPQPIREAFVAEAGALFDRVRVLCQENQTLATLRDTLLPRLMSGDLRVGAAREQVEDVA